jgi:exoribonuclease-2
MSTHPLEHQGLGVAQYAWSTSPLRRYADLVNQMQLLALLDGRAAPFDANDATLFGILSAFEARYAAVAEYQQTMERYWCLRWIGQHPAEQRRFAAVVSRDDTVRLADAPLYLQPTACPPLPAGARLTVEIVGWDELDLTVSARVVPGTISTARGGEAEALVDGGGEAEADVSTAGIDPVPDSVGVVDPPLDGVVDPSPDGVADPGSDGAATPASDAAAAPGCGDDPLPAAVAEPSDGGR